MPQTRHVSLFRNGRNQAIRIPREFELPGDEAILRKEGDRLVIEPVTKSTLADWLRVAEPVLDEMGDIADFPPDAVDL
ncbi:MAG: antitoxin [Bosea sp. (in: a-proteobacteria)]